MILSHVSNVFGSIAPLDEIAELLTAAGVPLILDASQSAGVAEIDVKRYPCLLYTSFKTRLISVWTA